MAKIRFFGPQWETPYVYIKELSLNRFLNLATEAVSLKKLAVMKKSVESILNIRIKLTVFIFLFVSTQKMFRFSSDF